MSFNQMAINHSSPMMPKSKNNSQEAYLNGFSNEIEFYDSLLINVTKVIEVHSNLTISSSGDKLHPKTVMRRYISDNTISDAHWVSPDM